MRILMMLDWNRGSGGAEIYASSLYNGLREAGDEVRLRFDASSMPPVKAGWKRDWLLKVDGWAKDRDANTAYSQTVEPLPFHGMSRYPYGPEEAYPKDTIHKEYRARYNQRPALRLIRPLVAAK